MLNIFRRSLKDALNDEKKVVIKGVRFIIKKIDAMDYINGSKVLFRQYQTYQTKQGNDVEEISAKKLKEHYRDIIMSGVVRPVLTRDPNEGEKIFVDEIFKDMEMADGLYNTIVEFTVGKKKLNQSR